MSQPFTDTTTLRLSASLLILLNEGAETVLFELQLGSVIKIKRTQIRLVKSARPASPRGNGVAQRGHVLNGVTQNGALQGIIVFDYENLRRLMSQIRPDKTMDRDLATSVGELLCRQNSNSLKFIRLLMNDHWFCEGFI
jgi:hypothetical protein